MGDFNAKVGKGQVEDMIGSFGNRNQWEDTLIQFRPKENYMAAITWFQLPERRIYRRKHLVVMRTT